jgi:hypothetical protein
MGANRTERVACPEPELITVTHVNFHAQRHAIRTAAPARTLHGLDLERRNYAFSGPDSTSSVGRPRWHSRDMAHAAHQLAGPGAEMAVQLWGISPSFQKDHLHTEGSTIRWGDFDDRPRTVNG